MANNLSIVKVIAKAGTTYAVDESGATDIRLSFQVQLSRPLDQGELLPNSSITSVVRNAGAGAIVNRIRREENDISHFPLEWATFYVEYLEPVSLAETLAAPVVAESSAGGEE